MVEIPDSAAQGIFATRCLSFNVPFDIEHHPYTLHSRRPTIFEGPVIEILPTSHKRNGELSFPLIPTHSPWRECFPSRATQRRHRRLRQPATPGHRYPNHQKHRTSPSATPPRSRCIKNSSPSTLTHTKTKTQTPRTPLASKRGFGRSVQPPPLSPTTPFPAEPQSHPP